MLWWFMSCSVGRNKIESNGMKGNSNPDVSEFQQRYQTIAFKPWFSTQQNLHIQINTVRVNTDTFAVSVRANTTVLISISLES